MVTVQLCRDARGVEWFEAQTSDPEREAHALGLTPLPDGNRPILSIAAFWTAGHAYSFPAELRPEDPAARAAPTTADGHALLDSYIAEADDERAANLLDQLHLVIESLTIRIHGSGDFTLHRRGIVTADTLDLALFPGTTLIAGAGAVSAAELPHGRRVIRRVVDAASEVAV